jgi:hypothetical protein
MSETELMKIGQDVARLRGDPALPVAASIVIPVNAQGDLENVLQIIADITNYKGVYALELILVINNYPPDEPPPEIEAYGRLGLKIVHMPSVRRPGEAVGFSARIPGVELAASENVILFDADCRVINPTALIDWYIEQFRAGAKAAYTHVDYYALKDHWSIRLRIFMHHAVRWVKRVLLGIPTTRGSNYAVNRTMLLELYRKGMLADEMNVGPTFKAAKGKVVYSGAKRLIVLTSGRMFNPGGVKKLLRYFTYRLFYNLRVLRVRPNIARYTKRENDPIRKYVNNKVVK